VIPTRANNELNVLSKRITAIKSLRKVNLDAKKFAAYASKILFD
jgi:hypothetical protein